MTGFFLLSGKLMNFSVRVLQPNLLLGDWDANLQFLISAAQQAHAEGVQCLLCPAQTLCGGPGAGSYLLRPTFHQACEQTLAQLLVASLEWTGLTLVVGHPQAVAGNALPYNAVSVLHEGQLLASHAQQWGAPSYAEPHLQTAPAGPPCVFTLEGLSGKVHIGVLLEQELEHPKPAQAAVAAGAQLLLVLQAQAFHAGQPAQLQTMLAQRAQEQTVPLVCANWVGGRDAWVFAGGSLAVQADGQLAMQAPLFEQAQMDVQVQQAQTANLPLRLQGALTPQPDALHSLWSALVLAVRDYVEKNRFPGVLLGLSGGIDSALVLAIAVDALGPERVRTVMMPSPYTADISWQDAQAMAERLGVRHDVIPIAEQVQAFESALAPLFMGRAPDTTEENLQARCRGVLLMALSNKLGHLVLTTSNKSEVAMGYSTLYGDMAGGFALLCDVYKTEVFALARWRNVHDVYGRGQEPIPERIITRPPSAELRPEQKDEDSLPPYPVLDTLLRAYLEQGASASELQHLSGQPPELIARVLRLLRINGYKRYQAPPGPRVSRTAFAQDWQVPMTHVFAG